MIRNIRLHRGRHAQSGVDLAKIVVGEVQSDSGLVAFVLFAESAGQPGEASNASPHGHVLPLNM